MKDETNDQIKDIPMDQGNNNSNKQNQSRVSIKQQIILFQFYLGLKIQKAISLFRILI